MALNITPVGDSNLPAPEAPKIYSEQYHHPIVDSVYQNENSILSMVPGHPRLVEYYRHVTKSGTESHAYQPGSGVYQQYTRIRKVILKESDLSFDFNVANATSGKTGSALTNFGLVPGKGDAFISDIGDGYAGLFTVTEVKFSEMTANKVYTIDYVLEGIVSKAIADELDSFVIEELVYSRDQHINGGNPIITQGEFDYKQKLNSWYPTLVHYMYEAFYWEDERTLSYTVDNKHYYDPYLIKVFSTVVGSEALGTYPRVQLQSLEYGGNKAAQHGSYNIWDVLFRNDWNLLRRCNNQAAILDTRIFYSTRLHGNIRSSNFDGVIVTDPENFRDMSSWVSWNDNIRDDNPIPAKPIDYLFTPEFYQGQPQTPFESLVVDVFKNNIIDLRKINDTLEGYWDLTPREQLYYGVILIAMIHKSKRMGKLI